MQRSPSSPIQNFNLEVLNIMSNDICENYLKVNNQDGTKYGAMGVGTYWNRCSS